MIEGAVQVSDAQADQLNDLLEALAEQLAELSRAGSVEDDFSSSANGVKTSPSPLLTRLGCEADSVAVTCRVHDDGRTGSTPLVCRPSHPLLAYRLSLPGSPSWYMAAGVSPVLEAMPTCTGRASAEHESFVRHMHRVALLEALGVVCFDHMLHCVVEQPSASSQLEGTDSVRSMPSGKSGRLKPDMPSLSMLNNPMLGQSIDTLVQSLDPCYRKRRLSQLQATRVTLPEQSGDAVETHCGAAQDSSDVKCSAQDNPANDPLALMLHDGLPSLNGLRVRIHDQAPTVKVAVSSCAPYRFQRLAYVRTNADVVITSTAADGDADAKPTLHIAADQLGRGQLLARKIAVEVCRSLRVSVRHLSAVLPAVQLLIMAEPSMVPIFFPVCAATPEGELTRRSDNCEQEASHSVERAELPSNDSLQPVQVLRSTRASSRRDSQDAGATMTTVASDSRSASRRASQSPLRRSRRINDSPTKPSQAQQQRRTTRSSPCRRSTSNCESQPPQHASSPASKSKTAVNSAANSAARKPSCRQRGATNVRDASSQTGQTPPSSSEPLPPSKLKETASDTVLAPETPVVKAHRPEGPPTSPAPGTLTLMDKNQSAQLTAAVEPDADLSQAACPTTATNPPPARASTHDKDLKHTDKSALSDLETHAMMLSNDLFPPSLKVSGAGTVQGYSLDDGFFLHRLEMAHSLAIYVNALGVTLRSDPTNMRWLFELPAGFTKPSMSPLDPTPIRLEQAQVLAFSNTASFWPFQPPSDTSLIWYCMRTPSQRLPAPGLVISRPPDKELNESTEPDPKRAKREDQDLPLPSSSATPAVSAGAGQVPQWRETSSSLHTWSPLSIRTRPMKRPLAPGPTLTTARRTPQPCPRCRELGRRKPEHQITRPYQSEQFFYARDSRTPQSPRYRVPDNWPSDLIFSSVLVWNFDDPNLVRRIVSPHMPTCRMRIEPLTDPRHPCCGEYGVFATCDIDKGQWVGTYTGVVRRADFNPSRYIAPLEVHDGLQLDIDAEKIGNESRFINDYRGVSSGPNVKLETRICACGTGEPAVGVLCIRPITKGEELLLDYGNDYWEALNERNRAQSRLQHEGSASPRRTKLLGGSISSLLS